ncbi:hypothetical protein AB4Z32_25530 [Massilia sp. 2TAF26]
MHQPLPARPSNAFVGASWGALIVQKNVRDLAAVPARPEVRIAD